MLTEKALGLAKEVFDFVDVETLAPDSIYLRSLHSAPLQLGSYHPRVTQSH